MALGNGSGMVGEWLLGDLGFCPNLILQFLSVVNTNFNVKHTCKTYSGGNEGKDSMVPFCLHYLLLWPYSGIFFGSSPAWKTVLKRDLKTL